MNYLEIEEKKQTQSVDAFVQEVNQRMTVVQEKLDKLLEGYLDGLIDEDTYKRKKEELVQQKITLKGEKITLGQKRMSGWIEPTRDFVNTLIQAGKIASTQSLEEISQLVRKIGTNRHISGKQADWNFMPPYDFVVEFLARSASCPQTTIPKSEPKNLTFPIWWAIVDSNHGPRHYQ